MATISDFNSLWEVGFAVNAVFVFFDYSDYLDKKMKEIEEIGDEYLQQYFNHSKFSIGGVPYRNIIYKWLPIKMNIQKHDLKTFSVFNTLFSLVLLLMSSYFRH